MAGPLSGTRVVDASRMLPGAVLDRILLDLGAEVVKVEDPGGGDPLRHAPPLDPKSGVGAAFAAFCAGARSVTLDLRREEDAAALRRLCKGADAFVESFRPGTLERWGLGAERLSAGNPALVVLSLSGYRREGPDRDLPGHDLNFTAASGLLSLLPPGLPGVPFSDVAGGVLAAAALLAALLERSRTGRGRVLELPLAEALHPFLAWPLADAAAGGGGLGPALLSGAVPAYGLYRCADGRQVALCCLEPKFWEALLSLLGIEGHRGAALDAGPAGEEARRAVAAALLARPSTWWLERARLEGLPLSPVRDLEEVRALRRLSTAEEGPPPLLSCFGSAPGVVPRLGEHNEALLGKRG
ncbi:MAG: CoA transferase [Acidobacteriota bacterium]